MTRSIILLKNFAIMDLHMKLKLFLEYFKVDFGGKKNRLVFPFEDIPPKT